VVDRLDEVWWRLRALYGLKNSLGKRIVAIGGPGGWGVGGRKAPDIARSLWKMDIQTVDYTALGEMIKEARQNTSLVKRCGNQAERYLRQEGISLQTDKEFVKNAFVLNEVFKSLMAQAGTDAITVNRCMGTIMPISETTACLPLTLLNDSGYTAYCESDFVVIPSGILLHYISGLPVFFNDPTYPHDGVVTLAHCTAPRKMNGTDYEPAKILTHFESDYGAAPKVEMKLGQKITVIDPDFASKRWIGFEAEIIDNPFLDICRSQIDVQINGDCERLVEETRGFHWMVSYGNYLRELGYALNKVGVDWLNLTKAKA
jgi:L-fucose isomerase-like protein